MLQIPRPLSGVGKIQQIPRRFQFSSQVLEVLLALGKRKRRLLGRWLSQRFEFLRQAGQIVFELFVAGFLVDSLLGRLFQFPACLQALAEVFMLRSFLQFT